MKILFFSILLFVCTNLFAQAEYIIEITPATGTFTKITSPIPGVSWVADEDGVYDESNGIFYFVSSSACMCLQGVSTISGSAVSSPPISGLMSFQFDNLAKKLYALKQDNANNQKMFGSVNPVTGAFTQIGSSRPGSALNQGSFNAFNESQHHFIFFEPGNRLVSIHASTGSVVASPTVAVSNGESIVGLTFNHHNGQLYAVMNKSSTQTSSLITINPQTGFVTKIGTGLGFTVLNGSAAIEEVNDKYLLLHSNPLGFNIVSIDVYSGKAVSNASLHPLPSPENAYNLVYDRVRSKVFAIHWSTSLENIGVLENAGSLISVFPIPASQEVNIQLPVISKLTVYLYDVVGKQVWQQDASNRENIILSRGSLEAGVYFLQLQSDQTLIKQTKIVFAND